MGKSSVTVFTFGDPDQQKCRDIGTYLTAYCQPDAVLGSTEGTGEWEGVTEYSGVLIVQGLGRDVAVAAAGKAASRFDQDAVGVLHDVEGRTCVAPNAGEAVRFDEL